MNKLDIRHGPLRVGIGGPVGAGKTSLTEVLCRALSANISMAVVTNDIYTREDADYLEKVQALTSDRILGVETGVALTQRYAKMLQSIWLQLMI